MRSAMSVKYALLALLSESPRYGLQLRDGSEPARCCRWTWARCSRRCRSLSRNRLVESDDTGTDVPRRRIPGPPPRGKGSRVAAQHHQISASPLHDELAKKILMALWTDVHEVVQVHRRYLVERMRHGTKNDRDLGLVLNAKLVQDSVVQVAGHRRSPDGVGRQRASAPPTSFAGATRESRGGAGRITRERARQ